jgi:hypothetical protein
VRRYAAYAEQRNAGLQPPAQQPPESTAPSDSDETRSERGPTPDDGSRAVEEETSR